MPTPASSRLPPPRSGVGRTSIAASLGSLVVELDIFAKATDTVANHLDEKTVRRSYRTWSKWIDRRTKNNDWAVAVDETLSKPLVKLLPKETIVAELFPAKFDLRDDLPWPRVRCEKLPGASQPLAVRILVIVDPDGLRSNAKLLAAFHREAVLGLSVSVKNLAGLRPSLGQVIVGPVEGAVQNVSSFVIEADASKDFGLVIDRISAPASLAILNCAANAIDRFTFAAALVRDEEAARKNTRAELEAQSDLKQLQMQKEAAEMARADISSIFGRHLRKFRLSRGGIDTAKIALNVGQQDLVDLIYPFHPQSGESIAEMVDEKKQLNWWQGTPIEWLKWSFNEKYRVSLSEKRLAQVTERVCDATFDQIKGAIRRTKRELTGALENAAKSHPVSSAALDAGALAVHDEAAKERLRRSIKTAFDDFTKQEASSFHVDMEDKGLIGQLSEARSAVFGLFFIVLMFSRPFGGGGSDVCAETGWMAELSCFSSTWLPKIMSWGMLVLMLVGVLVNTRFRHERKKAQIYQRFEARLGDFRTRLISLVERVVKDELALIDVELSENSASVDSAFVRMLTAVQSQIERSGKAHGGRGIRGIAPVARNLVLEEAQSRISQRTRESLEQRFRESFAKDFAEQLA